MAILQFWAVEYGGYSSLVFVQNVLAHELFMENFFIMQYQAGCNVFFRCAVKARQARISRRVSSGKSAFSQYWKWTPRYSYEKKYELLLEVIGIIVAI